MVSVSAVQLARKCHLSWFYFTGENHIIIVPGANNSLSEVDVKGAADMIKNCKVLMCQMEIDETVTKKAMEMKALSGLGGLLSMLALDNL